MVKVTPSGGGAKEKVQPTWRRAWFADPACTHGETPEPPTAVQAWRDRLQYSAVKRTHMRWSVPLPGMLARMPMESGLAVVSQMFTVAHSAGARDARATP